MASQHRINRIGAAIVTCASRPVPISLLLRASSRALRTSSRTERSVVQSSLHGILAVSPARAESRGDGNNARCTLSARSGSLRQILPNFFGSEAHDGSEQPHQRFSDAPDRGLRAAAAVRLRRRNIEPVFEHIEIERAQVDDAEMIQTMIDFVEGKFVVRAPHVGGKSEVCRSMYWSSASMLSKGTASVSGSKSPRLPRT